MPELSNPRHEKLVNLVALGTPYATAYMSSGFEVLDRAVACINACRVLARPEVKERLEELRAEIKDAVKDDMGVTREWMIRMLERNIAIAYGTEPYAIVLEPKRDESGVIVLDPETKKPTLVPTPKFRYEPAAANKSLELLAKLRGDLVDGLTLRGDPNNPIVTALKVNFVPPVADAIVKAGAERG